MREGTPMTDKSQNNGSPPALRSYGSRSGGTREELGETVEAPAARADAKATAQQRAAKVRSQVQDGAAHALHVAQDKTPEPVREKAGQAAEAARVNRDVLIVAGVAAPAGIVLVQRRTRRC
jgi:hypothetical protein